MSNDPKNISEPAPLSAFDTAMKGLFGVPKPELEAQQRKYEQEREKDRAEEEEKGDGDK